MNYIKRLEMEKAQLEAERETLLAGVMALRAYLRHEKFHSWPYVNVEDIHLRLTEAVDAATTAYFDAALPQLEAERAQAYLDGRDQRNLDWVTREVAR